MAMERVQQFPGKSIFLSLVFQQSVLFSGSQRCFQRHTRPPGGKAAYPEQNREKEHLTILPLILFPFLVKEDYLSPVARNKFLQ